MNQKVKESDLDLIQQTAQGNLEAWGIIMTRYKRQVFGIALSFLKNPHDAQDIVQDTFLKAYQKLDQYDLKRKFSPWLFAIAANLCKNKLKRDRFMQPLKNPGRLFNPQVSNPEKEVAKERRQELIKRSLNRLDYKYRAPLILKYYTGLTYEEISQALKIPLGTVKTRLHRAKAKLRNELEQGGLTNE